MHRTYLRRPFGLWHNQSYFQVLAQCDATLSQNGITRKSIQAGGNQPTRFSFQRAALRLIEMKMTPIYYAEARIRGHLVRWRLDGIPGKLDRQVFSNLKMLSQCCHPRVHICYFKAVWNAWVTDGRMRTLLEKQGTIVRKCVLGCGAKDSVDDLLHYSVCPVFWAFVSRPMPVGLGLTCCPAARRTLFFLLDFKDIDDKTRMALAVYALLERSMPFATARRGNSGMCRGFCASSAKVAQSDLLRLEFSE